MQPRGKRDGAVSQAETNEGGSNRSRPRHRITQPVQGQTPMPSCVAAAGVPEAEKVEPTKMPHEPGE